MTVPMHIIDGLLHPALIASSIAVQISPFECIGLRVPGLSDINAELVKGHQPSIVRNSVDDHKFLTIHSICFYIFLLQYQYTFKDQQIPVSPLRHNQNLPRAYY
jgi:hypothetical protein